MAAVSEALFLTDVPTGLKYKPQVRKGATTVGEALQNLGSDINNALFFTDLESVKSEKVTSRKGWYQKDVPSPPRRTRVKTQQRMVMQDDDDDDLNSVEERAMYLTVPPPALERMRQYEEKRAFKAQRIAADQMLKDHEKRSPDIKLVQEG